MSDHSHNHDVEKEAAVESQQPIENTEEYEEQGGDFQVEADSATGNLKTTDDGKIVLIPQPSDDPDDPLNWSWATKHIVLLSLLWPSLLTDWGMTYGATMYEAQAPELGVSVATMANSISGGLFMQGPGGVLAVPLAAKYGRLPVLFWSQLLSCMMVVGCSQAPTYASFTALRTLQGTFNTAPQVIGLSIVHDLFFFHERARKLNYWVFCFLVGPFFGPFMSALLLRKVSWRDDYAILASFYGFSLLMVIIFGRETLYDRKNPTPKAVGIGGRICELVGIAGAKLNGRPSLWTVSKDIFVIALRPQILLLTAIYVMINFMWAIGIVSTVSQFLFPPPYLFTTLAFALFFLAPMIGAIVGETWGHFFNNWLQNRFIRTHNGRYTPENRLWAIYPPVVVCFAGLILFGQTLEHSLSWVGLAFGWGMYVFGMLAGTTAVSAYALDSFPKHAAIVASIINFWRTTGGFCVSYFQLKWIARNGAAVSFGCQAAILAAAFLAVIGTQVWGGKWRKQYPPPKVLT